jgi:hypothetical protein
MANELGKIAGATATGATLGSVGTAIGAAGAVIGLATSIYGGIKAAAERKKQAAAIQKQQSENRAWYNANALGDYTQKAEAQNLLKRLRDNLEKQNQRASNIAVVTGATEESKAVNRELSNRAISDAYSNIEAMGENYMERITNRYLQRNDNFFGMENAMIEGRAKSYEKLMQNGLNTAAGYGGQFSGNVGKTKAQEEDVANEP